MENKIGFSGGLKVHGNINRILEMCNGGLGDNLISAHFKDQGVDISVQFVRSIRTEITSFSSKAISKKSTSSAIKGVAKDRSDFDQNSNQLAT